MQILLPILAILVPYKLYDENNLRKLLVVGIAAIILISFTMGSYHTVLLFDQSSTQLQSEQGNLRNGTIEPTYGDTSKTFNMTIELNKTFVQESNYTIYANISLTGTIGFGGEDYKGYNMTRVNDTEGKNGWVEYYAEVEVDDERLFNHYFSLKKDVPVEEGDFSWERTSLGFGPITLERKTALVMVTLQQSLSTSIIFLLGMGLLWLKKRMDRSVVESTEGLEEKEEELEDYCPECGHLLEGKKECDRCGWIKEPEDEMYDDEGEPD
ncbi:MAG: hypothetical protein KGY66_05315 [Candidatus Thermoplasmatota archaeon]|nr:hypothetical protein [Candidatus Thermoplasmatota archaeon]